MLENSRQSITIGIPSYSRVLDLDFAIESIFNSVFYPDEILVIDDFSPDRDEILECLLKWSSKFDPKKTNFRFIMSDRNEGYDRNLQKIISNSTCDYVMFLGNDDILLPNGIHDALNYLQENKLNAYSRSFVRFNNTKLIGISKFSKADRTFNSQNSPLFSYFRLSCFFSGLIFCRKWADSKLTNQYDGTLYYQLYLFGCAYFESGVGYISTPIVGGRVDGIPLFGRSKTEQSSHIPGGYTAHSRAIMWANILKIASDLDGTYKSNSFKFIHYEIKTRMAFHIFEMYSFKSIYDLIDLKNEYKKLNIFYHPIPLFLFFIVFIFRRNSILFFKMARKIYQR